MENENINKELREIAPELASVKKDKHPFKVPEDYFAFLPGTIAERINKTESAKRNIAIFPSAFFRFALPGIAVILIFVSAYFMFRSDNLNGIYNDVYDYDQLAWYSEYHSGAFYHMLSDAIDDEVMDDAEPIDDFTEDYLLDYDYYFLHQVILDESTENTDFD
jgi:hypothetical protein